MDRHIQELVYEKVHLRKAYNYYHCVRDADQFRHIEDNYGIGVPTAIGFSPLVKKHIDVLVGEYLELEPSLTITCKDEKTISNMLEEKLQVTASAIKKEMKNLITGVISSGLQGVEPSSEEGEQMQGSLNKAAKESEDRFTSEYEVAAYNLLSFFSHSRDIDMKNKMREILTDLLIGGVCYFRTRPADGKVKLDALNPLDTFVERKKDSYYLNTSPRCVIRRWMTFDSILEEYGEYLSSEDVNILKDNKGKQDGMTGAVYIRTNSVVSPGNSLEMSPGILGGLEATPIFPWDNTSDYNISSPNILVYEIEWLAFNKDKGFMERHEGIKIGDEVYIAKGVNDDIPRNGKSCTISVNGLFYLDKNGSPLSLILATADLQDKYDLLLFYRDNLIASSGTVGDWVDVASLPSFLGVEMSDRLQKYKAYKKAGLGLYDSSQEGAQIINTTFNGFDDTVKAQSIQAIQIAIESTENQVASITGVFPEKLGGIQQRDAVSNVKVGIKYSTLLTKQYFSAMDDIYREANYDLLNVAKIAFKKGFTGTAVLGDKSSKLFTALPKHYAMTDYDIHIVDSSETIQLLSEIKAMNTELIKAGMSSPDMMIDIVSAKSLSGVKSDVKKSMRIQKEENDKMRQMQQLIQQAQQQQAEMEKQMKEMQKELKSAQGKVKEFDMAKIEIEKRKLQLSQQELRNKKDYNDKIIENKDKMLEVEVAQMSDNNPYNDLLKH